ncbi:MAG: hypothetical protein AB6733_13055 [Clostridiaceae bacterium]
MAIDVIKYLVINKLRKYIRVVTRNKLKSLLWSGGTIVLLWSLIDLIKYISIDYYTMGFFIYCIAKLFQDMPIMVLPCQFFEFKILNHWQLKALMLVKSSALSLFIFTLMLVFPISFSETVQSQIISLLLINVIINLICFLKSQTKYSSTITVITLILISLSYYWKLALFLGVALILILMIFIRLKYFRYDEILPYYHSMGNIMEGLTNSNMDTVSKGQVALINSKSKSNFRFMEKYYGRAFSFNFYKEISRALYNYKRIINASLINFSIGLLSVTYNHPLWVNGAAMLIIVFISDNILTILNKPEAINKKKGFYFPYSLSEIIKQKYLVQLVIIFIPFLASVLILKNISIFIFLACLILLPMKNIINNFASKWYENWVAYGVDGFIFFIAFANIFF